MFTAALFERPRGWNQPRHLSTDKWIMEFFSDVKKIKLAFAVNVTLVKTAIIKEKKVNDAENGHIKEASIQSVRKKTVVFTLCQFGCSSKCSKRNQKTTLLYTFRRFIHRLNQNTMGMPYLLPHYSQ